MKSKVIFLSLLAACLISGCGTASTYRVMESDSFNPQNYTMVAIYDGSYPSFKELELAKMFTEVGLKVVGERESVDRTKVLGVRHSIVRNQHHTIIKLLFEDGITDKTMLTVEGTGSNSAPEVNDRYAWETLKKTLMKSFKR